MKAPRITKDSNGYWDLKMENGKVVWAEDGTQAAQHCFQRLSITYGEWILDVWRDEDAGKEVHPKVGTKWYQVLFKTSKSRSEKEFEIKSRILETPGIESIYNWSWQMSGHNLQLGTTSTPIGVVTQWGVIDIAEAITPL